jgi:hypothetical protein
MQAHDFSQLGYEIWGDEWASILAEKFEVRTKSVKRWANGVNPIPQVVIEFLLFQKAKKESAQ